MSPAAPRTWFAPDFPSGLVIEDADGSLWRVPESTPFDGDRSTLLPVRAAGDPVFPTEAFLDLVGVAEIAERAKVGPGTVHAWRARHNDFPAPFIMLKAGPIWAWASIERWLAIRPPEGRPALADPVRARVRVPISPVVRHLRGDGATTTYRLRDRFEPGSVRLEIDGQSTAVIESPDGRRFSVSGPPSSGADLKLEYRSILE